MTEKKERFEILLEELKKDFKAAFEGITTLRNEVKGGFETVNEKIDLVDGKVEHLGSEVRRIKVELGEVNKKVDKLDQKLDVHMRQPAHA